MEGSEDRGDSESSWGGVSVKDRTRAELTP